MRERAAPDAAYLSEDEITAIRNAYTVADTATEQAYAMGVADTEAKWRAAMPEQIHNEKDKSSL